MKNLKQLRKAIKEVSAYSDQKVTYTPDLDRTKILLLEEQRLTFAIYSDLCETQYPQARDMRENARLESFERIQPGLARFRGFFIDSYGRLPQRRDEEQARIGWVAYDFFRRQRSHDTGILCHEYGTSKEDCLARIEHYLRNEGMPVDNWNPGSNSYEN